MNMLSKCQAGFRKRNSTGNWLIEFLNEICSNMDAGRLTGILFLDLYKAFDTMDHVVAICKLSEYNMSYSVLDWFWSYLVGRNQVTKVNGVDSEKFYVVCGLPQGSTLGPLIFIIYVNSLPSVLNKSFPYLYADDMALVVTGSDEMEIVDCLTEDLNACSQWLTDHRLALNIGKTK